MAAEAAIRMGEPKEGFDRATFERRITDLVADNSDAVLSRMNAGKVTLDITKISADCWFRVPAVFTMIAKALMNLDRVVYTLDPNFDPNVIIRDRANEILQRNILKSVAPANLLSGVVDLKEFAEKLPTRVNRILDAAGNNELPGKVTAEMSVGHGGEGFKRALNDALRADVDPTSGSHLPVHHQAATFEFVEVFPVGPGADQIGVGD